MSSAREGRRRKRGSIGVANRREGLERTYPFSCSSSCSADGVVEDRSGASNQLRGVAFGAEILVNSKKPFVGQMKYREESIVTIRASGEASLGKTTS